MPACAEQAAAASREDWQAVFGLLDVALDLEPAARTDWLATLPPGQQRLAPLLLELLRTHDSSATDAFMREPASHALERVEPSAIPAPERRVGPYRLLREIGQGGMASVWLADRADGLLERQVALKLPHLGWGVASFGDRMARERNILASLTHPNIARLYDAGISADGRPYLALEYVDGQPIDAWAASRGLDTRARVKLIVEVARAVAHAHARLVVHRDLKPSNILVDAEGHAHLLDFGIARLIDPQATEGDTSMTQAPGRALTPDYASPEQIRGDAIGTASDVYSLGVVLFELLAGERPYRLKKGLGADALAAAIATAEAPRPSDAAADEAVARQLRGDLDAILARALAKASSDRYATVDAFADDLERHLRGEPVQARPDSAWYRAERWVRRHKLESAVALAIVIAVPAGAAAQAAVLAAIAGGAGVAVWQARIARRQTRVAREEASRAEAVKTFLTSFFKSGTLEDDAGAQLGRLSVRAFVERGARKIEAGFEREPVLKGELLDVVSTLFADLSDGAATVAYAQQWQAALERAGGSATERARAAQRLARGLVLLGRHTEALAVLERAVVSLRGALAPQAAVQVAHLLVDLARVRGELGEPDLAMQGADEAIALLTRPAVADAAIADALAAALFLRADLLASANRMGEAVPVYEDAIERLSRLHGERSLVVGRHRHLFASALGENRMQEESEREHRRARALFRESGGSDDLNAAIVELDLGRGLAIFGTRRAEGLALLEHAHGVIAAQADKVSPVYVAAANLFLAEAMVEDGELERARLPMEEAVSLYRDKVQSPQHQALAQVVHARYLMECGEYEASNEVLERTRAEYLRLVGPDHPHTASVVNRIGTNYLRAGHFDKARAEYESILGSQDQAEEVWGSMKHLARRNLALVDLDQERYDLARPALERFLADYHAAPSSARNAMTEGTLALALGRALLGQGQAEAALPHLRSCVEIYQAVYPRSPGLAAARSWLALCQFDLGHAAEARELAEQARVAFEAQPSAGIHYRRGCERLQEFISRPMS
ncbi:MAG: serine/threonine-protein kinase [Burkholderiales bacterium]|nr:serine/threonine-protein kinase [Burkholderiales bacterium]